MSSVIVCKFQGGGGCECAQQAMWCAVAGGWLSVVTDAPMVARCPGVSAGGRGRRACRIEYPRVPPVSDATDAQGDQEGLFAPINRSHLVSFRICFQKWITIKCKEVMRV